MIVKCNRGCWDSKRSRRYYPGDQDDIDPLEPVAMYFDFPPGTEVYFKPKAPKRKSAVATTRIVPGLTTDKEKIEAISAKEAELRRQLEALTKEKQPLLDQLKETE
jgi:hypothetical protein